MKKIIVAVMCAALLRQGAPVLAETVQTEGMDEKTGQSLWKENRIWQAAPGMQGLERKINGIMDSCLPDEWSVEGQREPEAAEEKETEAGTESETESLKEVSNIIFVGDSRVVGMSWAGGYLYVGKESIGYDWFVSGGTYQMQNLMNQYPDAEVVLCFGINDVGNIGAYISYYQTLMQTWPDTDFWVMSVNPVNDGIASACGYYINSSMVYQFNDAMRQAFPEEYLDVASYLEQNGFGTSDGVHYDTGTYLTVQEYAKQLIQEKLRG